MLDPDVFSLILWWKGKSKALLTLIILFDEYFQVSSKDEWRIEVENYWGKIFFKDDWDEVVSQNIFEVVSSLDRSKWDKSNEAEDIFLIDKKEVSTFIWVVSSEVEPWVESIEKMKNGINDGMIFLQQKSSFEKMGWVNFHWK